MKKSAIVLCIFLFPSFQHLYGQNSEVRELGNFDKITLSGNSKVFLTPGTPQNVRVESKNDLGDIKTVVSNGKLNIDGKPSSIYITIPAIQDISISGYGEMRADSMFNSDKLSLDISGKGKIILPVQASAIDVNISGYGKMKLSGQAETIHLKVSGNGTLDASNLKVANADVDISGVGKATIDVKDKLDMSISGVGSVYYKTEPAQISRNVSGVGKYGLIKVEEPDTTIMHVGNKRIVIIGDEEKTEDDKNNNDNINIEVDVDIDDDFPSKKPAKARSHWAGFDIGFNNWWTNGTNSDLPEGYNDLELNTDKSVHVGINFFKHDFKIYKRYIMFTTGFGLTLNNYRFSSDNTMRSDTNRVVTGPDYNDSGEQISYTKNKLAVNYFTVPLLFQFNTNERLKKSFHLGVGLLLSYKYNSHLKLAYDDNGDDQKSKRQDDYNIEPFRYDFTVRLGYRNYTLFGNYSMGELFKDGRGPTLHPYSIGLQLAGW